MIVSCNRGVIGKKYSKRLQRYDVEKEMKGLEWGRLYEEYHKKEYPIICPACKSAYWNKPRKNKVNKQREDEKKI